MQWNPKVGGKVFLILEALFIEQGASHAMQLHIIGGVWLEVCCIFIFLCCKQVKLAGGGWIDVPCMEDALLVNLGSFMQMWTSDRYLATVS